MSVFVGPVRTGPSANTFLGLSLRELPSADKWATIHRRAARRKPAGGKEYRRAYAAPLASTLSAPGATATLPERKSPPSSARSRG